MIPLPFNDNIQSTMFKGAAYTINEYNFVLKYIAENVEEDYRMNTFWDNLLLKGIFVGKTRGSIKSHLSYKYKFSLVSIKKSITSGKLEFCHNFGK